MAAALRLESLPAGLRGNERGHALIFGALLAPVIVFMAALAVDAGAISNQKREMQGLADMAAIAAAANIDHAERTVYKVLADNGFLPEDSEDISGDEIERRRLRAFHKQVTVELGRYTSDEGVSFDARFEVGGNPANAVRVSLRDETEKYFSSRDKGRQIVSARGTAMVSSQVAMSIGSRLARLEDGLLNAILSALTGSEVELRVMDYNALLDTDIDLFTFTETLASDLDLTAGTYDEVLQSDAKFGQVLQAMAAASEGSLRGRTVLEALASDPAVEEMEIDLATLIDFGEAGRFQLGEPPNGLELKLEAVQMLTASAIAANGDRQLVMDLGGDVPGLASVTVSLMIGERPQSTTWFSVAQDGHSMVSTAQLRLLIDAAVLPGGALGSDAVRLPVYIELASAKASVRDVICHERNRTVRRVDIDVRPSIAELRIADLPNDLRAPSEAQDFEPATLLDAKLIRISGYSRTSFSATEPTRLRFQASQIGGDPKTVETTEALEGALTTAIGTLQLKTEVLGVSLLPSRTATMLVEEALLEAARPVDAIVSDLSDLLGISLGEADVWVHDAQCNKSVLVQ